ncbi:MAG TPA: DUF2274 domain-containing protein [Thiobacillus sp.]|jgi:hypothetical protein|uniref:Uncharacterized protein n=2 Tax=Acidovorax carolinensis TaxID=553814 RepID=A0A240TR92_9BURK|nr:MULTISPECIES: DUF2274 domain-containing protein [Comamonadaceae]HQS63373.1 DUF2274 domain-containing protein [Acidovorax defluvii]HQT71551.1 DUF2274 domain-containing protein [Thiobacillus sp.]ART47664.1 hypothetical protein CBP33_05605 [Acidovorax carolinensis]ART51211.1 hypothetical protein CBP34_05395 [Acidovorax carolinensis]ART55659.1 hypothetical protein CBP35_12900 [Acidovorax carolinensis]
MSTSVSKLRLGPLPKTETVKLTIVLTTALKADLERYAALHAQAYGEPVDAVTLIPHMLESFIMRDRGFKKQHAAGPDALTRRRAANGSTGAIRVDALPE